MVTSTTSRNGSTSDDAYAYYYQEDADAAKMAEMQGFGWMEPIIIDDDDLMFGGKSLSAWYEEERKTLFDPEEERRGRQRVCPTPSSLPSLPDPSFSTLPQDSYSNVSLQVRQSSTKPSRHQHHERPSKKPQQHGEQEKQ